MTIEDGAPATEEKTGDALFGRLFEATLGAFDLLSVYLGDRLGLYRALHDGGPATAGELATRAGIDPRYALEWLEQQAVTGFLEVEDSSAAADERRFSLPDAYVGPLADPDSPLASAPLALSIAALGAAMKPLTDAYRTGGGVEWADYGTDLTEAQGAFNRPWLVEGFATAMLPAIRGVAERLAADPPARVADVACGVGWAGIAIARAYPGVRVDGFDIDEASVEIANRNPLVRGINLMRNRFHEDLAA